MSRINFYFYFCRIPDLCIFLFAHLPPLQYGKCSNNQEMYCTMFSAMDPLLPLSGLEKGTAGGVGTVPPAVAVKGTLAWHFFSQFLRYQSTLCVVLYVLLKQRCFKQCSGSMTFWYGSGSGSADPYLWLTHPDPTPDPAIFVSNWQLKIIDFFAFFL